MARPLGHRQTKGTETDKPNLRLPRHISTLPCGPRQICRGCHGYPARYDITNDCPDCSGIGVQFAVESLSSFVWNRCPVWCGIRMNCGKRAASRWMSSERIIGRFYEALPLDSGGKPHNARRDSIDDAWPLRRPPDVELRPSVGDFEGRTVLRTGFAVIVNSGRGDVGVTQPLLHLGNVGLVVKRIGRGGRPQRVRPDRETQCR
jgi:hypothetical protein